MRILHITFFRSHNCGAVLQAWALNRVLEELGHVVIMPDCIRAWHRFARFRALPRKDCDMLRFLRHIAGWVVVELVAWRQMSLRHRRAVKFAQRFLPSKRIEVDHVNDVADVAVVGSDQVWNEELTRGSADFFYGRFLRGQVPILGYGVSVGDKMPEMSRRQKLESIIKDYSDISVRESFLADFVEKVSGQKVPIVLDPTLLLPKEAYAELAHPKRIVKERYLYVYELHYEPFIHEFAERFAAERGLKVVYSAIYHHGHFGGIPKEIDLATSPDRFLAYIRDAEYVLASSFHGTLFALMYGKKVLTMRSEPEIGESRVGRLFENFGLESRLFVRGNDYYEGVALLDCELPKDLLNRITPLRKESMRFLEEALQKVSR